MRRKYPNTKTNRMGEDMKALVTITLLLTTMLPALAGDKGASSTEDSSSTAENGCATAQHAHLYSDIRIAAVEVTRTDSCGFSYADLESNTVGLDNHLQFTQAFEIVQILKAASGKYDEMVAVERQKSKVKQGMRALAVYCMGCMTVFNLQILPDNEAARKAGAK
jgi:hypothetical protein